MKIIALGNARMSSTRLKNKMLLPYAKTSLAEIAIKKISSLKNFDSVYFAAYDKKILKICNKYLNKNSIIIRDRKSSESNYPLTKIHNYLENIDFDYCMWINSCHAILNSNTIDKAVKFFRKNNFKSMTAVIKKNTWFYDKKGKPINVKNPKDQVMSQKSNYIYEVCHAFHIFNKKHFFKNNTYWNNNKNDPYLYEIDLIEAIDVDNINDFKISESVYKSLKINKIK